MSHSHSQSLIAAAALLGLLFTACNDGYISTPDQQMYGLKGPVTEVRIERSAEQIPPVEAYISYDTLGRLIEDPFGNFYSYDPDGAFVGGNHHYTTIERDADGRLIEYMDEKGGDGHSIAFGYDGQGRLASAQWLSDVEARTYTIERDADGRALTMTVHTTHSREQGAETYIETYTYTMADDRGNWTERRVLQHAEVGYPAYNVATGKIEIDTSLNDIEYTDRRQITYRE